MTRQAGAPGGPAPQGCGDPFAVRRLPVVPLLAALGLAIALSMAANFVLFRSELLHVVLRWGQGLISGTLVANLLLLLAVVWLCLHEWGGARAAELGLRRGLVRPAIVVVAATWILLHLSTLAAGLGSGWTLRLAQGFADPAAVRRSLGECAGQVFGNALYEEILFRGVLVTQMAWWFAPAGGRPDRRAVVLAVIASQAVFALHHIPNRLAFESWSGPWAAAVDLALVFVSGVFFAAVFLRTQNLLIAVGMHSLGNLPTLLVAGPGWVHAPTMLLVTVTLLIFGPRWFAAAPAPGTAGS